MRFSYTQLMMYLKCGEKYRRRYIMGDRELYGTSVVIGRAQHKGQEFDLNTKIETKELAPLDAVLDCTRDASVEELKADYKWSDDEKQIGTVASKRNIQNRALKSTELHHGTVAPMLEPLATEVKLIFRVPGIDREVVGYADIVESDHTIRDTKNSAKRPTADQAERSEQLALYSLGYRVQTGEESPTQVLDYLVCTPKQQKTTYVPLAVVNTEDDQARIANKMKIAIAGIDAGVFPPAPDGAWWCGPKWCGFYSTCPFVRGGKLVTVPGVFDGLDDLVPDMPARKIDATKF